MNNKNLLLKLTSINEQLKKQYKDTEHIKINKHNTLFILDWDDTLFPTSWATKNNINLTNSQMRDQYVVHFQDLDRTLLSFFKNIMKHGKVIIITNALVDWVNMSSIVIPHTYHILRKINIISAREHYKNTTNNVMEWKKMAFQAIIDNDFNKTPLMNIISIGDAEYEHQALVALTHTHNHRIKYLKSFRLIRDPTYEQLIDQINVLDKHMIPEFWQKSEQICKSFKTF